LLEAAQAFVDLIGDAPVRGFRRVPGIAIDPTINDVVAPIGRECKRKNFVDLSSAERNRLAAALNDAYDRGVVESFANEHADNWFNVHFGPAFLPWHRHFLLRFERELQSFDSRVYLPYWDWTRADSRNLDEATLWRPFFGGRANEGGQFDHWRLERGSQPGGSLPSLSGIVSNLQAANFRSYAQVECLTHHGGPHMWVGGDMSTAHSPRDPLFYLHHGNIDRLWALWQRNHPNQPQYTSDLPMTACWNYPNSFVGINEPMAGGATPRSMLDHLALGYFFGRDDAVAAELPAFETGDVTSRIITPARVSFGRVVVGDVKIRTVPIRAAGPRQLALVVAGPAAGQNLFTWFAINGRIDSCETRNLTVQFRPRGVGQASTTVRVVSHPVDDPQDQTVNTIQVSGAGIGGHVP
jgi:hypothetical protein